MSATEKQVDFITDLLDQRELTLGTGQTVEQLKEQASTLSKDQASAWINRLKSLPRKPKPFNATVAAPCNDPEPDAGMYRRGEDIVRVYLGQQSGKMLLKRLVEDPGSEHGWSYEYEGRASYKLKDATPLPLEEAKQFGRMTGTCCVCARRLDVPESVEAGIGPVCAKRFS